MNKTYLKEIIIHTTVFLLAFALMRLGGNGPYIAAAIVWVKHIVFALLPERSPRTLHAAQAQFMVGVTFAPFVEVLILIMMVRGLQP